MQNWEKKNSTLNLSNYLYIQPLITQYTKHVAEGAFLLLMLNLKKTLISWYNFGAANENKNSRRIGISGSDLYKINIKICKHIPVCLIKPYLICELSLIIDWFHTRHCTIHATIKYPTSRHRDFSINILLDQLQILSLSTTS